MDRGRGRPGRNAAATAYHRMVKALVTGSSGHLGEALVRTLRAGRRPVVGIDVEPSPFTTAVGAITDRDHVRKCMREASVVYHTATLHKPHVATHSMQEFVDTNVQGTLALLEEAQAAGVSAFVFTSTTSVFGDALRPPESEPAAWITEEVEPVPKNIYGVTKVAAEDLCAFFHRKRGMNCLVLRTSRFFPEEDDDRSKRADYEDENLKVNEFPFRRVELQDVVDAHLLAAERARDIGFGVYVISATTPFRREDLSELRRDAPSILKKRVAGYQQVYRERGWKMFSGIDRVYVNDKARAELDWRPKTDFAQVLARLSNGRDWRSPIARAVGSKGYHERTFEDGPYPVD